MNIVRGVTVVLLAGVFSTGCGSDDRSGGLSFAQRLAKAKKEPRPEVRAKEFMRIALAQAKADEPFAAEDSMELAKKTCREIEDPSAQTVAYSLLAEAHRRLENPTESARAANAALAAAGKVESVEIRARSLARVGRALGIAGSTDRAIDALKQAEQLAEPLDDLRGRTLVLVEIAASYRKIEQPSQADRVIAAAMELAKTIEDARQQCEALCKVAARQHAMRSKETSATFDLALAAARRIEDPHSRAYALADLAEALSKAARHTKTHNVLDEAHRTAGKISDVGMQRQMLDRIRELKAKLPKPAAAA